MPDTIRLKLIIGSLLALFLIISSSVWAHEPTPQPIPHPAPHQDAGKLYSITKIFPTSNPLPPPEPTLTTNEFRFEQEGVFSIEFLAFKVTTERSDKPLAVVLKFPGDDYMHKVPIKFDKLSDTEYLCNVNILVKGGHSHAPSNGKTWPIDLVFSNKVLSGVAHIAGRILSDPISPFP